MIDESTLSSWGKALAIVAAFGVVGAFIDFYIGKPGERRVRDWLETWWLRLSYVHWGNIGREEALLAVQVIDRLFGERFFSWKRIGVVIFVTLACAALILTAILVKHTGLAGYQYMWAHLLVDSMVWVIVILFTLNASLSIMRLAAKIVAVLLARTDYFGLLGLIFLFLFQCTLFIYWNFLVNWVRFDVSVVYNRTVPFNFQRFFYDLLYEVKYTISVYNTRIFPENPRYLFTFLTKVDPTWGAPPFFMFHLSALTNVLPSLIRLSIMTIFILSFFLKPLQNAIMTLWARVIESDKPVFTLVFGGAAALAKAIQEIVKSFWR
jgi:hypothetical protein